MNPLVLEDAVSDPLSFEQVRPPSSLADTIECFWRLLLPMVVAPDEVIFAEGRAEILFQFHGQSQIIPVDSPIPFNCASSWLMRPFAHALHVRQVGITSSAMIGVRFTAGGWATFSHRDTTDKQTYSFMPLSDFYAPSEVRLLEEQLFTTLRTPQWANPLVTFFTRRQVEHPHSERIRYAAKQLHQRRVSISALAHEVNLSERQFGRVFRQIVGLSPKQFARITRIAPILKLAVQQTPDIPLEQLALNYGFHDASHLVREFQELVGMSPMKYFYGNHDLIEQKFRKHDRFLQWELDILGLSSDTT